LAAKHGSSTNAPASITCISLLPEQPDLNWRNPQVKEALFGECAFWLDRGVDGFRLDVAHMFVKAIDLPDNPRKFGVFGYDRQDHSNHVNRPETHAIWKEFRQLLNRYDGRMAVGEVEPMGAEGYYGDGNNSASGLQLRPAPSTPLERARLLRGSAGVVRQRRMARGRVGAEQSR
jgi:hypothetical protein